MPKPKAKADNIDTDTIIFLLDIESLKEKIEQQ